MTDASIRPTQSARVPSRRRPRVRASIISGVAAFVVVLGAGAYIAATTQPAYSSDAEVVVLPQADLDTGTSASYYETLGNGQIVATYAEVASNAGYQARAEQGLGLSAAQKALVSATVTVVPNTSVLLVTATSGEAAVAKDVANSIAKSVTSYVSDLNGPYRAKQLATVQGAPTRTSTSPTTLFAIAALVALVVGIVVQQLVYQLMAAFGSRRATEDDTEDTRRGRDADGRRSRLPDDEDPAAEPVAPVTSERRERAAAEERARAAADQDLVEQS